MGLVGSERGAGIEITYSSAEDLERLTGCHRPARRSRRLDSCRAHRVGLSGGVDSSVAAALLVEQGLDVVGVTLRVWPWQPATEAVQRFGSCCSPATVDDARQVARRLGIPYYLLNSEAEFDRTVIEDFAREYEAGRTPVPCTVCNREVKFGSLLAARAAWDAVAVATGTRRIRRIRGDASFWTGSTPEGQSDVLWRFASQFAPRAFP